MRTLQQYYDLFRADGYSDYEARLLAAEGVEFNEQMNDETPIMGGNNDSFPIQL